MLVDRPFDVGRNVLAGAGLRLPDTGECDAERRRRCGHDLAEAVTGGQNRVLARDGHAATALVLRKADSFEECIKRFLAARVVDFCHCILAHESSSAHARTAPHPDDT